ncbi:MAG TPA: ORF6N domain-containing protein [Pelobium sp.]
MENKSFVPQLIDEHIMSHIYLIRGQKIILDRDLAKLYQVQTKVLKQAVKRNIDRFPNDFMFEMTDEELANWRSQFVTSNDKKGLRYAPFCFTEQGVAMLSSVLNSKQAIQVNIQIMRIFTRIREMLADNSEVKIEIAEMKNILEKVMKKQDGQDKNIDLLFTYIDRLQERTEETPKLPSKKHIGFKDWGKVDG